MSRQPIGTVAMSNAERSRRRREKAKANGAVASNGKSSAAGLDFLAGSPEAIAERIFEAVPIDTARGIAMALQQRLLQGGCWPSWRLPMV